MYRKNIKNILPCSFMNIKSKYILKQIFNSIEIKNLLKIVKYNKIIQEKLEIGIKDYQDFIGTIEIEIIPPKFKSGKDNINIYYTFINYKINEKRHFHIYLNNKKNQIKDNFLRNDEKGVNKIIIIIDKGAKSFNGLFEYCNGIEKIKFIKFYRQEITDMSNMFYWCDNLIEANFENFKTKNVINMSRMFYKCDKLRSINLNNFDTTNVISMNSMFKECSSLQKVVIKNFKTDNVKDMTCMFGDCKLLSDINISNLNLKNVKHMTRMFSPAKNDMKIKLKKQNKYLRDEAFE